MVLRGGKQKVTLLVVHDLGERTLVSCDLTFEDQLSRA